MREVLGFFSKRSSLLLSIGHEAFITIMVQSLPYSWTFGTRENVSSWSRPFLMLLFNPFLLYCIIIDKETEILVHNKNKILLMIMFGSKLSSVGVVFQNMVSG